MIKLAIFDLDGVLVDACEWHRIALNQALREICNFEISLEDHYEIFNGLPTKEKLKILTKQKIVKKKDYDKISQRKQEITLQLIETHGTLDPTKVELIKALQENGVHVACFTNSIRQTAELMLRKCGILNLIELLVTNEDVKKPKPSSEGYLKVIRHFKVPKKNVIIVEDSPKGMAAAQAAKCRVIPVANATGVTKGLFEGLGVFE
jgi:beta-phosphoglucomutase